MVFSSDPLRDTERYKALRDALRDAVSADTTPNRRQRRQGRKRWWWLRRAPRN
jgi:hypothetical protein